MPRARKTGGGATPVRKSQSLPHDAPGWPQNRHTPARILSDPGATRNRVRRQGVLTLRPGLDEFRAVPAP